MSRLPTRTGLDWRLSVTDALARWPASTPLAALVSGDTSPAARPWSRWTILAAPTSCATGGRSRLAPTPTVPPHPGDHHPDDSRTPGESTPPFLGGWIGVLDYELGYELEPTTWARREALPAGTVQWLRCPAAYVHDARTGRWWATGAPAAIAALPDLASRTPVRTTDDGFTFPEPDAIDREDRARDRYQRGVARVVEYIRAGDVFQVNLTRRVTAAFRGSARGFFRRLLAVSRPWYGAYLELPGRVVVSASPELFLSYDARTRRVITRPMKGTRGANATAADLAASGKDAAELAMIVDLMRNDLGRVAEIGSVRVDDPRAIERHGAGASAVLQGVATVSATLRRGLGVADLLAGAFPPGSVTGAPKVRAMQIIDELERPVSPRRGPYCGCIGYLSDSGDAAFSVAIRTGWLAAEPGTPEERGVFEGRHGRDASLVWGVGAGIVSDSEPEAEWRETLHKSAGLARVAREGAGSPLAAQEVHHG